MTYETKQLSLKHYSVKIIKKKNLKLKSTFII